MRKLVIPLTVAAAASLCILSLTAQSPVSALKPLFTYSDGELAAQPVIIGYGDMRFTDPKETSATNPVVRKWLVDKIAVEKPDAVLMSGDVPWHGGEANDYAVYHRETAPWRDAHIRAIPALGNHELNGLNKTQCLENWWNAFPALRGYRWYAVQFGSRVAILNLDSNSSLLPGGEQFKWLDAQLKALDPKVKFVFINLHHPPVADYQVNGDPSHNPRPNEISLADYLQGSPLRSRVRFVVCAGHIHNYERFLHDEVTYLVSGGAGADPRKIVRAKDDLYQNPSEVNYHYLKFTLRADALEAEMVRVADPAASRPTWEVRDRFRIEAK